MSDFVKKSQGVFEEILNDEITQNLNSNYLKTLTKIKMIIIFKDTRLLERIKNDQVTFKKLNFPKNRYFLIRLKLVCFT